MTEAYEILNKLINKWPQNIFANLSLLLWYAIKKDRDKAEKIVTVKLKNFAWNDFFLPLYMAECYSLLEVKREAIKWLERSVNKGMINYPLLNTHDSFLDNIRGEKRFKELMKKIKVEWENFEV